MDQPSYESRSILAIQGLQKDPNLSLREAAKIYEVNRMTLARRRAGQSARQDSRPNSMNITESEEQAVVQYVIELATRSLPPRLHGVEEMANYLLRVRDAPPVVLRPDMRPSRDPGTPYLFLLPLLPTHGQKRWT